jgi:serine/threonine protein kinase
MPLKTAEEFLSLLERSNLLSPEDFAEAREISENFSDATQFAKTLAREQIISFWQAGHLLQGRSTFFLGKYRLISLLGRGGMGSVFLASHVVMHRKVALKFIPARIAQNPAALDRFLAEARTIAALDHSNIVRAYSVDNEGKRYYLVMEYVDGMDLQRAVEAYGPLDIEAIVDYIQQAADGLAHAHKRNMIHCDIKPSNLIVTELDGTVKILDMGLARLVQDKPGGAESSSTENHLGSVDYLAPEQAMSSPDFNHRADIYALGCTMYFLLTGQPPFPTGTLAQRIVKHQTLEPEDITHLRPEVPVSLSAICKKMMAKNPANRYQTAAEVRDALAAWQPEVPQPAKKALAIKKIVQIEDLSAISPWEQEFGDELKNLAGVSGGNDFGALPGMSGKMPVIKNGSSSTTLKQILAGTRNRLILTSCTIAVLLVFLAAAIIISIVYRDNSIKLNVETTNPIDRNEVVPDQPKPPPSPQSAKDPQKPPEVNPEKSTAATPPTPVSPPETSSTPNTPATDTSQNKPTSEDNKTETAGQKHEDQPPLPEPDVDPLKGLLGAIELPECSKTQTGDDATPLPPVSLGKVLLDAKSKLKIELFGGDRVGKGGDKYTLQEDPTAVGGQAWNISRDSHAKSLSVARLKLKDGDLNFDWNQSITPALANPLRNCGVAISVGEQSNSEKEKFVQFRIPKSAEPLVLDLDKGSHSVQVRLENLPDISKLLLVIQPLNPPFPTSAINPEVLRAPTRKSVEISFAELPLFSIFVTYETTKRDTIILEVSNYLRGKFFKISGSDKVLKDLKSDLKPLEKQLADAKNNAAAKESITPMINAAKAEIKQTTDTIETTRKLNGQVLHYQIFVDYTKFKVELCNSQIPPSKETAKSEDRPNRSPGK